MRPFEWRFLLLLLLPSCPAGARAEDELDAARLPQAPDPIASPLKEDWLIHPSARRASVCRGESTGELILDNGLIRRSFLLQPNVATTSFDNLMTGESLLRAVGPEGIVTLDGRAFRIGGLGGQKDPGYLARNAFAELTNDPAAFQFTGFAVGQPLPPLGWKRVRHAAPLPWPPPGVALSLAFRGPDAALPGAVVRMHYELYDGVPVMGKWLTLSNGTSRPLRVDGFTSEHLRLVEAESAVDERPGTDWRLPAISVLSDYMFKGMDLVTANQVARWSLDPDYTTQVNFSLKTPCVLDCQAPFGPGIVLAPGETFASFRSYLVIHDSTERERQGLTLRRALRTLAPWITENPIMMHVRSADRQAFRAAVDQCAEVGFEMIIYTFGSGLNAESDDPAYLEAIREDVAYARTHGVEVGAYSLFSSRRIDDANDVVDPKTGRPGGAVFGNAPCLASTWGTNYLRRLTHFLSRTGLTLLEHDGPYPGDRCAATNHPAHRGLEDSQWAQWKLSSQLYAWCRERGIYVNQPDYYFLTGGTKTGMGYREGNWSLPRAQQMIHARQNIFDGTWTKPQTAGWMFVPLTEYQGGGPAATLEPLDEHLPDYEAHLANTLGAGVQACWRGPRLYDTEATRDLVKRWVAWYKEYRDILESDVLHVRRADGRDLDYLVHVNPALRHRAFAMIHNPLDTPVERQVPLPLYYSGLTNTVKVRIENGSATTHSLDPQFRAWVPVRVPARGHTWLVVEAP